MRRTLLWTLLLATVAASCAEGTGAGPADAGQTSMSVLPTAKCGDGKVDADAPMKEQCDCGMSVTSGTCAVSDPTVSCESLMNGTGVVLCDATSCMFNVSNCTMGGGGSGGAGAGG